MGYDTERFPTSADEELICPICGGVLQDPLQAPACEHTFCRICINEWLLRAPVCPIDRIPIEFAQLRPVPRIIRNLLNRLNITCENEGCLAIVKLEALPAHLLECDHNPKKLFECENGCGMMVSKDNWTTHNCIQALRTEVDWMKNQLQKYRTELDFYKSEVRRLQESTRPYRTNNPTMPRSLERAENNEVLRWSGTLQLARVTRWGGMISTPDSVLQAVIKRALLESGCPINITDQLMEHAHERYWPQALSTLETRQLNRQHYEGFVSRRIVGKQAVVVLACDNRHADQQMVLEPGIVMIFAHGVE